MLNQPRLLLFSLALLFPLLSEAGRRSEDTLSPEKDPFRAASAQLTLDDIRQPWKGSLKELGRGLKPSRNYIFWLMIPPKDPIDLRSADKFRQFLNAHLSAWDGSISHNIVAWRCGNGRDAEGAAAMTGESYGQSTELMKSGFGLATFFAVFHDGYLQGPEELDVDLRERAPGEGLAGAGFEVSDEQCASMLSFLHSFVENKSRPYLRFGLGLDPEKMQGGGCTSFAMSLMNRAGLFTSVTPAFYRTLEAPRALMGGNLPLPYLTRLPESVWPRGAPRKIPFLPLLKTSWGGRGEDKLRFLDPELMLYSLKTISRFYVKQVPAPQREEAARGFYKTAFGYRVVVGFDDEGGRLKEPNPRHYSITKSFSPEIPRIEAKTNAWMESLMASGFGVRVERILNQPILIVDRP